VNATAVIWRRFAGLVRPTSEFWATPGADVKGGVFSGLEVKLGNLKSLISGGVTFATPDDAPAASAGDGAEFTLHEDPKDAWLKWSTPLPLGPQPSDDDDLPIEPSDRIKPQ
jgi:paraquat-inducible protein B